MFDLDNVLPFSDQHPVSLGITPGMASNRFDQIMIASAEFDFLGPQR
jgi:hypothetical protein